MTLTLQELIFYFASTLLLFAALMVITTRHPVRGVMFLILAFIASAVLWMLLEAEFLSLVLIFVYVGAVMTLFLFIVMMLNLENIPTSGGVGWYLPAGVLVASTLAFIMLRVVGHQHFGLTNYPAPPLHAADYSNIKALGAVLYTDYVLPFEIAAVILLVAIIAAIGITFRGVRYGTKFQQSREQVAVRPEDRVRLVKMKSEKPL